jgi:protein involved in polysaccharide export with SLBB domain
MTLALGLALIAGAMVACSSGETSSPIDPSRGSTSTVGHDSKIPSVATSALNQQRLKALWDKRSGDSESEAVDYPVGPGDVIEVTVTGVDDLKERTVRVSGQSQIELPLIGIVSVGGLTEAQVRDKLKQALSKYMYDPQVDVFVKEYHSRQVAVVGAVRTPGLVTLTGNRMSILDVITQAGGMTADAANEIVILPEVTGGRAKLQQLAASYQAAPAPGETAAADTAARAQAKTPSQPNQSDLSRGAPPTGVTMASLEQNVSNGPAVVIPLKSDAFQGSLNYTNMPVKPGDIVVVPGGGNVMVTGWVYRPGFFQVGSGLTVLGAVGSAGGAMYAAAPASAVLIRSDATGNKVSIPIDLNKIAKGEEADIPVRANDVIDVPYSDLRIAPYVVYNVLTRMAIPLPAF